MTDSALKVGVLGVRGLPPAYGAFDQCLGELIKHSAIQDPELKFFVACDSAFRSQEYSHTNVDRFFIKRIPGLGILLFSLIALMLYRVRGVQVLLSFGYGASILFPFAKILGMRIVCNTDGFEWRRQKWGRIARRFFKVSEWFCAKFADALVYDATLIARYFSIKYGLGGSLLRYGCEEIQDSCDFDVEQKFGLSKLGYLLLVMRLEPENNIKMIVEAFIASRVRIPLVIVGPTTTFFERQVKPLLDDRCRIFGPIYDRVALKSLRDNAAGYLHGHSVGGTNPTLVEAVDSGLAVLAFDTRFNREVLGRSGNYFRDVESLTTLIEKKDWKIPNPLSEDFLWDNICANYCKILRGNLNERQ